METNKILSSLSYFSILFAPFLLPIIVYFVSEDREVKYHAKRSLISHIFPVILTVILFFSLFLNIFSIPADGTSLGPIVLPIILMLLYMLVYGILLIWNIIQGIKVLR